MGKMLHQALMTAIKPCDTVAVVKCMLDYGNVTDSCMLHGSDDSVRASTCSLDKRLLDVLVG